MPLIPGQSLSFFQVLGPLGAGGMGEVYRARDTRLEREVAIKVLPEELASDAERLRRFEREAKILASLNHPNVAGIHGVDQVDGVCFLALELVPGEDLATRLSHCALPVDEAIDLCRQIAEGLEAAHEAGVVHRDLKPANVRITPDGVVKILDFGLAKPIHPTATREGTTTAESDSFLMTEAGLVLGTPTYMSPEQARGKPVDRRTDIWAFGCVLFECLTGRRAFSGESLTDVLAAIVEREPDWAALPVDLPPRVAELLRRCLDKKARNRLRDVGEARIALEDPRLGLGGEQRTSRAPWFVAALAVLVAAIALWMPLSSVGNKPPVGGASPVRRVSLYVPADQDLRINDYSAIWGPASFDLSPDGRTLVYSARTGSEASLTGEASLFVRSLDSFDPEPLAGTGGGHSPAFSPDGRWVAFRRTLDMDRTPGPLVRVALDGSPPIVVLDPLEFDAWPGCWLSDTDLLVVIDRGTRLGRSSIDGGEPVPLPGSQEAIAEHGSVVSARRVPGRPGTVLVQSRMDTVDRRSTLWALSTEDGSATLLVEEAACGQVTRDGRLLFLRGTDLMSAPLDLDTMRIEGQIVALMPEVAQYRLGESGDLVYAAWRDVTDHWQLAEAMLDGTVTALTEAHRPYFHMDLSSDGSLLAVAIADDGGIWARHMETEVEELVSPKDASAYSPVLSPDAESVAYALAIRSSRRDADCAIVVAPIGGSLEPREIYADELGWASPAGWSRDGTAVFVREWVQFDRDGQRIFANQLIRVPLTGGEVSTVLDTSLEFESCSSDGSHLAYTQRIAQEYLLIVTELSAEGSPVGSPRRVASAPRITGLRWGADGRLYYRVIDEVFRVSVDPDAPPAEPEFVVDLRSADQARWTGWHPLPEGEGILMVRTRTPYAEVNRFELVQSWSSEP